MDRLGFHDAAPRPPEMRSDPKCEYPVQLLPSHDFVYRVPSAPRTNTSSRFGPHDATAGLPTICWEPHCVYPDQPPPVHALVDRVSAGARTETAGRVAPPCARAEASPGAPEPELPAPAH